jgi:recombination protein RecA
MSKALEELSATIHSVTETIEKITSPQLTNNKDKWAAIKTVEKELNKQFKTDLSLVRLGDKVGKLMPSISTNLPTFDYDVIGTGGIPRGRIAELYGEESSGKTTFALFCVAEEQKRGNICAYIDVEFALDPSYMASLGVDVNNLVTAQPESAEQTLDTVTALVDSGAVSLIVIDSVASIVPQAELDGDSGDVHMGLVARLMGQAMRRLRGKCAISNTTLIFINQTRQAIGITYGNPTVTPGGKALKFFSSVRIQISKVGGDDGKITKDGEVIGHKMRLRCTKNKVGMPAKVTEVDLIYGKGLDISTDVLQYALNHEIIAQKGAYFDFEGERVAHGKENLRTWLESNPSAFQAIQNKIKEGLDTPKAV